MSLVHSMKHAKFLHTYLRTDRTKVIGQQHATPASRKWHRINGRIGGHGVRPSAGPSGRKCVRNTYSRPCNPIRRVSSKINFHAYTQNSTFEDAQTVMLYSSHVATFCWNCRRHRFRGSVDAASHGTPVLNRSL